MPREPQPATLELPVRREEDEQVRFREAGTYTFENNRVCLLICVELGEEDTRYTQGRDSSSSANSQHLCDSLSFVHIYRPGQQINHDNFKCVTSAMKRAMSGCLMEHDRAEQFAVMTPRIGDLQQFEHYHTFHSMQRAVPPVFQIREQ
jgi:hypothetical protein